MGFIFGLIIGGAISGGGGGASPNLLQGIPFRCLAAFEMNDNEYWNCRSSSMRREPGCNEGNSREEENKSLSRCLNWELAGLREWRRAVQEQQKK